MERRDADLESIAQPHVNIADLDMVRTSYSAVTYCDLGYLTLCPCLETLQELLGGDK